MSERTGKKVPLEILFYSDNRECTVGNPVDTLFTSDRFKLIHVNVNKKVQKTRFEKNNGTCMHIVCQ